MWRYLKRKLGIYEQDIRIENTLKEIQQIKQHISQIQAQKPKIIKQIIYQRPENDPVIMEVNEIKERELKTVEIISEYKNTFLDFVDLVSKKLENFDNRLERFEKKTENSLTTQEYANIEPDRSTKRSTKRTTSRPIITTKRPTNTTSTTDQIEQGKILWENATDTEREIIQALYDAGYPLSYGELAEKLNKSLSTVKNHLNNMKAKGFQFQERTGLNNTKKYLLDFRVKTFLTLRLND